MPLPRPKNNTPKQLAWHPHYDDSSADIVFVSSDGIKFGMGLKLLAKSSTVFAGMKGLPLPAANQKKDEQQIDLRYDQATVLHFLELISISNFAPLLPTFDFTTCQSLLALTEQFDCVRIQPFIRHRLFVTASEEKKSWELFKLGATKDDWPMGRQGLRGMTHNVVSPLVNPNSGYFQLLVGLNPEWQLVLSSMILDSSFERRQLIMDWSTLSSKFCRPGSASDQENALAEEKAVAAANPPNRGLRYGYDY